ncbi:hypothetical protein H920_13159 [Fukomys damarensis]|uniref:Uncharacterized protein n=1 Tax=Fukomys damarensis TaxID=885580 RepID=A0A091D4G1_FUKDA|nr:hypothetical protein H920_13159 [Fukomys damarensis]
MDVNSLILGLAQLENGGTFSSRTLHSHLSQLRCCLAVWVRLESALNFDSCSVQITGNPAWARAEAVLLAFSGLVCPLVASYDYGHL